MNRRTLAAVTGVLLLLVFLRAEGDLAPKPSQPQRRKAGEGVPPLPLPATPIRRTEQKRQPAPPVLIVQLRHGKPRLVEVEGQKVPFADWNTDPGALPTLLHRVRSTLGLAYRHQTQVLAGLEPDPTLHPILYFTGHEALELSPADLARCKAFLEAGGTIWGEACCGNPAFARAFERHFSGLFPGRGFHVLPPDHPLYRTYHNVKEVAYSKGVTDRPGRAPHLLGIDLGCRTAVLLSPYDLGCGWDRHEHDGARAVGVESAFELGVNMVAHALAYYPLGRYYAAPKVYYEQAAPPKGALVFARVKHGAGWDNDPSGPALLLRHVGQKTHVKVQMKSAAVSLTDPDLASYPFLYMSGHRALELSAAEESALKAYLQGGGFLLADACCGRMAFTASYQALMKKLFPQAPLAVLPADHALYGAFYKIGRVAYSPVVAKIHGDLAGPLLLGLETNGSLRAVLSPISLGCGWEAGPHPYDPIVMPEDAYQLGTNIILHAMTH